MKLIRNLAGLLVLFLVVDIGRYAVFPDIGRLALTNPGKTAFMKYREAQWRKEGIEKSVKQSWVPLKRVSPALIKAVLIAEDNKFWKHEGFDYEAIEKAIERNIREKTFRVGASTISQQLAKNLYLSPSKNPVRKIKEAILTWRIEHTLSKRRILELYVNVAEWGDGIFGIEQAARHYYGTSAQGVSAYQAARLAAVLPNPLRYRPDGSSRYVRSRAKRIYAIMLRRGVVVPFYREVMAPPPSDSTSADSMVVGVPEYLINESAARDSLQDTPDEKARPEQTPDSADTEASGKDG
jgi:monofunctional biosynthetic peptidoglycan transglycosylase